MTLVVDHVARVLMMSAIPLPGLDLCISAPIDSTPKRPGTGSVYRRTLIVSDGKNCGSMDDSPLRLN